MKIALRLALVLACRSVSGMALADGPGAVAKRNVAPLLAALGMPQLGQTLAPARPLIPVQSGTPAKCSDSFNPCCCPDGDLYHCTSTDYCEMVQHKKCVKQVPSSVPGYLNKCTE